MNGELMFWVMKVQRWILHIDMDAFFAAVEQRDNPALRGLPVIIGGLGQRGVVSTASYEARRYGIRSAMPMSEARRKCPQGIYLAGDHGKYARVTKEIQAILNDYSPRIEPLSLDEAFLDVSGMELLYPDVVDIAREIKRRIKEELNLTASAGLATNKFIAKIASDMQKPDGLTVVRPGEEATFLRELPVEKLWGIGGVSAAALKQAGISTIGQLAAIAPEQLKASVGAWALDFQRLAQGMDARPVEEGRMPKSVGNEETYEQDIGDEETALARLFALACKVGWRMRRYGLQGRTVTIKVRAADFKTVTRSRTSAEGLQYDEDIYRIAKDLFSELEQARRIRLLGVTVSHLQGAQQLSLFTCAEERRKSAVYGAMDRLRERFGKGIVQRGITAREQRGEGSDN